jgi:hypothetical protein
VGPNFRQRAYQLVDEPESPVTTACSGKRAYEQRKQFGQSGFRVGDDVHLGRIPHADVGEVDVDLGGTGLAELGQVLAVGKV